MSRRRASGQRVRAAGPGTYGKQVEVAQCVNKTGLNASAAAHHSPAFPALASPSFLRLPIKLCPLCAICLIFQCSRVASMQTHVESSAPRSRWHNGIFGGLGTRNIWYSLTAPAATLMADATLPSTSSSINVTQSVRINLHKAKSNFQVTRTHTHTPHAQLLCGIDLITATPQVARPTSSLELDFGTV